MSPEVGPTAARILLAAGAASHALVPVGNDAAVAVRDDSTGWQVLAWAPPETLEGLRLKGKGSETAGGILLTGPASPENAAAIRTLVPWLRPKPIGQVMSVGLGDRLGMATPGHIAALASSPGIMPIVAQQSAREVFRTGRSFIEVLDAATFGVLASGWRGGFGSDADHLRSQGEVEMAARAGYTMFTVDPIEVVPELSADAPWVRLRPYFERLSWADLEDDERSFLARYPGQLDLGDVSLRIPKESLRAAAARFGSAIVRTVAMYRHLQGLLNGREVDFEVAVDETMYPTTTVDHLYLATELRRLGVRLTSFAPRFVGTFEKGIDYLGDRASLAADVRLHASVARWFGTHRISVHSGSDKFSVFDTLSRETQRRLHLKTSGTSYLVALLTIGETEPELLDRIWRVATLAYERDRRSYLVSASAPTGSRPMPLARGRADRLLRDPSAREILHVTYGAVLRGRSTAENDANGIAREHTVTTDLGHDLKARIWAHRRKYWSRLQDHISGHVQPFSSGNTS